MVAMEMAAEDIVIQETVGAEVELLEDVNKAHKQSPPVSCLNRVDTGQRLQLSMISYQCSQWYVIHPKLCTAGEYISF